MPSFCRYSIANSATYFDVAKINIDFETNKKKNKKVVTVTVTVQNSATPP